MSAFLSRPALQLMARGSVFVLSISLTTSACVRTDPSELPIAPLSVRTLCIDHAVYAQSFDHGEFAKDGLDLSYWKTQYSWGRSNPGAHDAAFYANPKTFGSRYNPFAIARDPLAGGQRVLEIRAHAVDVPATLARGRSTGLTPLGLRYVSGTIQTWGIWSQRYGYFVARLRLPRGQGLWPAFWMLDSYGAGREWDIVEGLNQMDKIHQGIHAYDGKSAGGALVPGFDPSSSYHDYGVLILPGNGATTFYVDGQRDAQATDLDDITSSGEYLLLGLQVGGPKSWPGEPDDSTHWPAILRTQYVRAYRPTSAFC